jgi:hypothetical protein
MSNVRDSDFLPDVVVAQPRGEIRPRIAARCVDDDPRYGIAQANECKFESERTDERVGQAGRDGRRLSSDPRGGYRRNRNEISQRRSEALILGCVHVRQVVEVTAE